MIPLYARPALTGEVKDHTFVRYMEEYGMNSESIVIRVYFPDDTLFHVFSHSKNRFHVLSQKKISEMKYDILIKINGEYVVRNDLKGMKLDQWHISRYLKKTENLVHIYRKGYKAAS